MLYSFIATLITVGVLVLLVVAVGAIILSALVDLGTKLDDAGNSHRKDPEE